MRQSKRALLQAIEKAGGVLEFARKISEHRRSRAAKVGFSRYQVWRWVKKGKLPAELVLTVEDVTNISRTRLRPDIYPS